MRDRLCLTHSAVAVGVGVAGEGLPGDGDPLALVVVEGLADGGVVDG